MMLLCKCNYKSQPSESFIENSFANIPMPIDYLRKLNQSYFPMMIKFALVPLEVFYSLLSSCWSFRGLFRILDRSLAAKWAPLLISTNLRLSDMVKV